MNRNCLIILFCLSLVIFFSGCSSSGDDDYFSQTSGSSTPVITESPEITLPEIAQTSVDAGVVYNFPIDVSNVKGTGVFSATIENVTSVAGGSNGTSASSVGVDLTGLTIGFSPLSPLNPIASNTFRSVGTLSAPFATPGTVRITVFYEEDFQIQLSFEITIAPVAVNAFLNTQSHIGGAATALTLFEDSGSTWALYNIANVLHATQVGTTTNPDFSIEVEGYIFDIDVVTYSGDGERYALLAMGSEGIAVVRMTNPTNMLIVSTTKVNHYQDGITWTEGGGDIIPDNIISSTRSPISALETDGITLWIANEAYGLHKTALSNLLGVSGGGPLLESDGTLLIDLEKYTLQYAGENPWGGPNSLKIFDGKLFVTLGYLGMGIFDRVTLDQIGRYNLYTDANVTEDWFIGLDVADVSTGGAQPGFLDSFTGMPDYNQASFEILEVWKNDVEAPTPWADFDRYGREYYKARKLDVATFGGSTIAYIAYGLGGLIAVDVTGYDTADTGANFLNANYLGYAPAVPAHGPDTPTGRQPNGLFSHFGSGMLKESGVIDVKIDVSNARAYYSDHFAGMVLLEGADDPSNNWRGPSAPYDNDDLTIGDGILGDHWPDYEFVTSYDMSGYDPEDNETLPIWMYASPSLLVTGEISGHGNAIVLMPTPEVTSSGFIDVVQTSGAGGVNFIDIFDLSAPDVLDRFSVPVQIATTSQIGAAADGTPTQSISIGHTQGVAVSNGYLYVGDGPHGMSVWKIADSSANPIDDIGLVANTLQDEYPVTSGSEIVYPTPHAYTILLDNSQENALVLCQSLGLRRIDITDVENGLGVVGNPLLLKPSLIDIFEHNTDSGNVVGINRQDHAYDVALKGNYAFVADGSNGLTVYDLSKDPTVASSGFVVSNLGAESGNPLLGRATAVKLWADNSTGKEYAFVASGHAGIGVVEITDIFNLQLVKIFEPIKIEDGKVGHADGRSVDLQIIGNYAYFTYDSFGMLAYLISDLIAPLPQGIDPSEVWKHQGGTLLYDYRPEAVAQFKLQEIPGYEEIDGGALGMTSLQLPTNLFFFVAYGFGGVAKIDWTNPANPILVQHANTAGEAVDVAVANGRVYVADGSGGLVIMR